jgi:hypothetical protein
MLLPPASLFDGSHRGFSGTEQRGAHRVKLVPGRARLEIGNHWRELGDVSATGGGITLPAGTRLDGRGVVSATVHLADQPAFRADFRVMRTEPVAGGTVRAGAHFAPLEANSLRSLSRFVVREYLGQSFDFSRLAGGPAVRTEDPHAIAKLLQSRTQRDAGPVHVFRRATALPVRIGFDRIPSHGGADIEATIAGCTGTDPGIEPGVEYTFVLSGRASVMVFTARVHASAGDRVRIGFPRKLLQTGFRASHRTSVEATGGLSASFALPWAQGRIVRPICNVSARGLSFDLDHDDHTLFPGDELQGLQIDLPGGAIAAKGVIKSLAGSGGKTVRCGIEIDGFDGDVDRRRWHGFVFARAHPRICRTEVQLDQVWDVFEKSSYLDKWIASGRTAEIRSLFDRDWRLSGAQNGELLLLKEHDSAIGTIAANQIYPRTWLMHSLAVDKRHRQKDERKRFFNFARELYSGINYSLQHISGSQYFVAYFEEGKNWNQRLYRDFARDYVASADQLYESFHVLRKAVMEVPPNVVAAGAAGAAGDDVKVVAAGRAELRAVSARACATLPAMVVDAMALREDEIDLVGFAAEGNGLKRRRDVFVALEDGRPALAAICEAGGQGINIFGLMNLCWTIPMVDHLPGVATYRALIDAVAAHYRRHDVPDFLFLEPRAERIECLQAAGLELVSSGIRWLARVAVLPAWLGYVENELFALEPTSAPSPCETPNQ